MKNSIIALVLALTFSSFITAQKKGDIEFGVNVGLNNSTGSGAGGDFDSGMGYNFGGSMDYYFSTDWSIKAKLIYDQKGWDNDFIEDVNTGITYSTDVNLNYLTVPVMANWHFGNKRNWYLNFGLYMGFLLDAKENRFDSDITEYFNDNDFGLAFGVGVKVPVSPKLKVFFEFDGQGGFSDVFKDNVNTDISNTRSSLNVGLNFLMK